MAEDTTRTYSPPSVPTRIILRLLVKDFDNETFSWSDYYAAVEAYLVWANRPIAEYKEKKHNIHVEPFQDLELRQKRFHVIIDLNALSFEVKNMNDIHHEVYEIKRDGGTLNVLQAKKPEVALNIILKTRHFIDTTYPWHSEGWDNALNK